MIREEGDIEREVLKLFKNCRDTEFVRLMWHSLIREYHPDEVGSDLKPKEILFVLTRWGLFGKQKSLKNY